MISRRFRYRHIITAWLKQYTGGTAADSMYQEGKEASHGTIYCWSRDKTSSEVGNGLVITRVYIRFVAQ